MINVKIMDFQIGTYQGVTPVFIFFRLKNTIFLLL